MDMQNVLDRLKQIENPTEDQAAAIKSAEAMTQAPAPAEAVETTATGENIYTEYKPAEPADYAKLAGIPTLAVQTEPTNESVETEEEVLTESVEEIEVEEVVAEEEIVKESTKEIEYGDWIIRHEVGKKDGEPVRWMTWHTDDGPESAIKGQSSSEEKARMDAQEEGGDSIPALRKAYKGPVKVVSWIKTHGGQTDAVLLKKGNEYALGTDLAYMDYVAWWQSSPDAHWEEYTMLAKQYPEQGYWHWKSKAELRNWIDKNPKLYRKNIEFGADITDPEGRDWVTGLINDDKNREEVVAEGPTRKDFQMVADLIKNADPAKKAELAQHHADVFAKQNPRFDKSRFMAACGVTESIFDPFEKDIPSPTSDDPVTKKMEEAYDPLHVADIIKKHEANGHEVEMDPFKDDEAGFTVTFKDGSRRHYHYTKTGVKVDSLEPVDAMVDPDAPKRERGRPKKEAVEEEVDELTRQFESKLADLLPEEEVVTESAEQINESINVSQTINDEGQESVNINAQGNPEHIDMVKQLLRLAGQPKGYEEYTGEPEAEEANEELANAPDVKVADVDTQLNKMSGGLNGPKDKSALRGDSVKLHDDKDLAESLLDLYKEYKG